MNLIDYMLIIIAVVLFGGGVTWCGAVHLNMYKNYHYICLNCSKLYKPKTFRQSLFGLNGGDQRMLKCPHCGKREWANMKKDE